MDATQWLYRVRGADATVRWLKERYREEWERACAATVSASDGKVQTTARNRTEERMMRVTEYAVELERTLAEKQRMRAETVAVIRRVEKQNRQMLLFLYFVDGKSWKEVADEMGYSMGYVVGRLRQEAIASVREILEADGIL